MANDEGFDDNPFRSGGAGSTDVFFDATAAPAPAATAPPQQQQQFQQQQQQFQPQQPPPMQSNDTFAPMPSGPMDNMAPQLSQPPTLQQPNNMNNGQQQQQSMSPLQPRSWWGNCMACLTIDSYAQYFDIDAEDIANRMKGVILHFYKPEYFRNNVVGIDKSTGLKGPDLYGPFWITMTLIFFIGVRDDRK